MCAAPARDLYIAKGLSRDGSSDTQARMPTEQAKLRTRRGELTAARAELLRYGSARRYGAAAGSLAFGVAIGIASLAAPLLHFVLPWLFPIIGAVGAFAILRVRGRIAGVSGECPACHAAFEASNVGSIDGETVWLKCESCGQPLELVL